MSPADHQKWANPVWVRLSAIGGAPAGDPLHARLDIKARALARIVGARWHQYTSVNLDFSGPFAAFGEQEFKLNTRTI
jgi:hypothetical protein